MLLWVWRYRYLFMLVFSFPLTMFPELELRDHRVDLYLIFWGNSLQFSIVTVPVYNPTNGAQEFPFLHIHTSICYLFSPFLFDDSYSNRLKVISQCSFNLHFPNYKWCWASFHVSVGHFYISFGEMSIQVLCPILNCIIDFFFFLPLRCMSSLHILNIGKYFSHFIDFFFYLSMASFAVQKLFSLM